MVLGKYRAGLKVGGWVLTLLAVVLCTGRTLTAEVADLNPRAHTKAQTLQVGNLQRTYYVHVPAGMPEGKLLPVVMMFHGGGGTAAYAERESRFSDLADREGFLAVYPEGVDKSWNDGRGHEFIPAQRQHVDDVGFVAAMLDQLAKNYPVDTRRIYATGISNGGIFSHYLGLKLSQRIAAIAPVAGGISVAQAENFKPQRPVSVLIIHGKSDPLVPYNGGDITVLGARRGKIISTEAAVKIWVEIDGCQGEPAKETLALKDRQDGCSAERMTYRRGKAGTEVSLLTIVGGGHTWPGGIQYLPENIVGKLCHDLNASKVIWEFFVQHPMQDKDGEGKRDDRK